MIFMTGATGMTGAHILLELLRTGYHVRALCRSKESIQKTLRIFRFYTPDAGDLLRKVEWHTGDVLDSYSLATGMQGAQTVIHCSAQVSFHPRHRKQLLQTNIEGTANMVDAALAQGVENFAHISSIAAVGEPKTTAGASGADMLDAPALEQRSAYSRSKYYSELEVWRGQAEGLRTVIVNPSVILGPGNWRHGSPGFFYNVWKGMRYYTTGGTGFVDVRDVAGVLLKLLAGGPYNQRFVLNAANLSYQGLFTQIARAVGVPAPKKYATPRMTETAWRIAAALSTLTRGTPKLTRETARNAHQKQAFSALAVEQATGFRFRPIGQTIDETAKLFLADVQAKAVK